MTKAEVLARMRETGLVPVLRASSVELAMLLAEAILAGGVTCLEVTMTVPGALDVMRLLRRDWPEMLLGAGTVLDPETARRCILEGAQFVVSPAVHLATVEMCHRCGVAVLPGALTPTEIVNAWQAGADVVKVFPVSALGGAAYLRSVKAPLPQVELMPTGGVSQGNAEAFLEAGAFALGVGADLADEKAIAQGRGEEVTANARGYVELVRRFRSAQAGRLALPKDGLADGEGAE